MPLPGRISCRLCYCAYRDANGRCTNYTSSIFINSFADGHTDACTDRYLTPYRLSVAYPVALRYARTFKHARTFQYVHADTDHSSVGVAHI